MRPRRCYIYLLVWIIIFSTGLYWSLSSKNKESATSHLNGLPLPLIGPKDLNANKRGASWAADTVKFINPESSQDDRDPDIGDTDENELLSSVDRQCNDWTLIKARDENLQHPAYSLDAVVLIFRHGDRGPLSHVGKRNVSHISCRGGLHSDFQSLYKFVTESMAKLPGYYQFIGPFHSFPKVPTSHVCRLGQLTQVGSSQLLHLGQLIRATYSGTLPFSILDGGASDGKVIAYSTRYRRTLQSLMAFLFGLLGPKLLIPTVTIRESQSINFCFNDCSCRATDRLQKMAKRIYNAVPEDKSSKSRLVNSINSVLGLEKDIKTGVSLLDLLLVYPCHKTPLPCRTSNFPSAENGCISHEALNSLISIIKKETLGLQNVLQQRQHSLLSCYGLLKEILGLALRMTSGSSITASQTQKSRLAIFSGHDTTLQSLIGALGIRKGHPDLHLPPFASRMIFEFYRKAGVSPLSPRKHFFRVIYNGYAVTHLISFCKNAYWRKKTEFGSATGPKEFLCPLENLVRFMHDNYFESFGNATTNFRDACR